MMIRSIILPSLIIALRISSTPTLVWDVPQVYPAVITGHCQRVLAEGVEAEVYHLSTPTPIYHLLPIYPPWSGTCQRFILPSSQATASVCSLKGSKQKSVTLVPFTSAGITPSLKGEVGSHRRRDSLLNIFILYNDLFCSLKFQYLFHNRLVNPI